MEINDNTLKPGRNRMPLFDGSQAEAALYIRRLSVAAVVAGGLALAAFSHFKNDLASVVSTPNTPTKLAEPLPTVEQEIKAGEFAPGQVLKVTLPEAGGVSPYDDAVQLAGGNTYSGAVTEDTRDIVAQVGDQPLGNEAVYLPASDVANRPPDTQEVK